MRALDTNVLARFFIDDADDAQAARQRPSAVAALSERAFVAVTVLMELEWVMRGFYGLPPTDISRVLRVLSSIEHITLEEIDLSLYDRAHGTGAFDAEPREARGAPRSPRRYAINIRIGSSVESPRRTKSTSGRAINC